MHITERQFNIFKKIIDEFKENTRYPIVGNWESKTDDNLWIKVVTQISEVGNSKPGQKLLNNNSYQEQISFNRLKNLNNLELIKSELFSIIKLIGVRF